MVYFSSGCGSLNMTQSAYNFFAGGWQLFGKWFVVIAKRSANGTGRCEIFCDYSIRINTTESCVPNFSAK